MGTDCVDDFELPYVEAGYPILHGVWAPGVLRHITANARDAMARWIRCVEESDWSKMDIEARVYHPWSYPNRLRNGIDVRDISHVLEGHHDAAVFGHRAGGQPGA